MGQLVLDLVLWWIEKNDPSLKWCKPDALRMSIAHVSRRYHSRVMGPYKGWFFRWLRWKRSGIFAALQLYPEFQDLSWHFCLFNTPYYEKSQFEQSSLEHNIMMFYRVVNEYVEEHPGACVRYDGEELFIDYCDDHELDHAEELACLYFNQ